MTLLELKTQLIKESGRTDLVVDTAAYVDNGIQHYIDSGQRYLDTHQFTPKSHGWYRLNIVSGAAFQEMQSVRAIKEVWMQNVDGRFQLIKRPLGWMRENYADQVSALDVGTPAYWAHVVSLVSTEQQGLTRANYTAQFTYDADDLLFSDENQYDREAVMWMPPADGAYTLQVLAEFFSKALSADADENFWTLVHPEILIMAAQRAIEVAYRNTEGVKDWNNAIFDSLVGIDSDLVKEEQAGVNQMEEPLHANTLQTNP